MAGAGVADEIEDRIGLDRRLRRRADRAENAVDDPAVLHVGRQQAERRLGRAPSRRSCFELGDRRPLAGRQEQIFLVVDRLDAHALQRLVVEIGDARIEFELLDAALDLLRGQRQHRHGDVRDSARRTAPVRCETIGSAVGITPSRSRPVSPLSISSIARAQVLGLGEDAMGVLERELALRGQADETMAALDERRAELLLELPDRRGKRRLRDMTRLRRPAEMLFARQRHEICQLSQHHARSLAQASAPRAIADSARPIDCGALARQALTASAPQRNAIDSNRQPAKTAWACRVAHPGRRSGHASLIAAAGARLWPEARQARAVADRRAVPARRPPTARR